MDGVYDRLGVRTIINACGPVTRLSGAKMDDEVTLAMQEAARHCVDMAELEARAGEVIAEVTGAEAGYVTSGASAGLLLATAACVTGLDPGKMNRLPDTAGMRSEVIIPKSHRNFYDHAIRTVGVTLVEVGISDRYSGAGVRDTEAWEIADAISERTAAVAYVANSRAMPPLTEVVAVAHAKDVPVIVDAAGQLPPGSNLRRFTAVGADAVCFSGGKVIGGPQGSGILCGRKDIVASAALQHLDQDVLYALWDPPAGLVEKGAIPGIPHHGIGRPCKVGKEQIVGLIVALQRFVSGGEERLRAAWDATAAELMVALSGVPCIEALVEVGAGRPIPCIRVRINEAAARKTALELAKELMDGDPSIHVQSGQVYEGQIGLNPMCLREGDEERIARRMRELLA